MEYRTEGEKNGVIETFTGALFDPFNPDSELIRIEDIAHALSNLCRFAGHSTQFYSVAQHSINCSKLVPREHALSALLHDATEAYMVDMPTPIKNRLPKYMEKEDALMEVIYKKFNLEYPMHPEVKKADKRMLEIEFKEYKGENPTLIPTMSPREAEKAFLARYYELLNVMSVEEVKEYRDHLTVGTLLEVIKRNNLPMDAKVLTQRVEDSYFEKKGGWKVVLKEDGMHKGCYDMFHPAWYPVVYKEDDNLYIHSHY